MSDAKKLTQAELETEAKSVVDDLVGKGEMFTVFDVTKQLRASGFWVEHYDVKDVVHGAFERGSLSGTGYARTLVPVPGKSPAFVYHVYTQDAQDYDPSGDHNYAALPVGVGCINKGSGPTTTCKPAPSVPKVPGVCVRDNLRRVNVPNALVYAIGLKVGDRAFVYNTGYAEFLIRSSYDINAFATNALASYIVNCKGNIRISGRVLDEMDAACDSFVATLDTTGVSPTPVIWLRKA